MLLAGVFMMVAITSCDKGFTELNTDPNNPTSVPSKLLLPDVTRITTNAMYSTFWGGDMGECWAQHWAKVQYNSEARYIPRESVIEGTIWQTFYEAIISDAATMENLAVDEGNPAMQGAAKVLQAFGYAVLTDVFGDIPFSDAMRADEGILQPAYDEQADVYAGIFALLDEAEALFAGGEGSIDATSDILYGGDAGKWRMFGNSLKFRALMRISGVQNVGAELQALVDAGNMFGSNADEAKLVYLAAEPNANPIFETIVFSTRGEFKVNSVLVDMLTNMNDPRLGVYAQPNSMGEYRGKPSGYTDIPSPDYNYENVSAIGLKYLEATAPGYFISNAELHFLMAEAAKKGYISGGDVAAEAHYNEGIRASFDANGISADYDAYVAQTGVAYDAANALQQIAEQNWLGLFCQGVEAWTEWRRTGYPELTPAIEGEINEIPSRYTYPALEQSINNASWSAAVASQGTDALTTKVWWDQ
jgi:hypothetical protein